jgi:hypothetical protein
MQHDTCGGSDACCSWAFSILAFILHLSFFFKFKQMLLTMLLPSQELIRVSKLRFSFTCPA